MTRDSRMISGLVPRMVMTFSLATQHPGWMGVRTLRVQNFRRPEQDDHLYAPDVFDTVGHAGRDVHHREVSARHTMLGDRVAKHGAEADDGVAFEHAKFFHLEVVVVIAPRDARVRARDEHLPEVG